MVRDQTWLQTLCVEEMLEARYHDYDENGGDEKDEIGDYHDWNDDNTHDENGDDLSGDENDDDIDEYDDERHGGCSC